MDHNPTIQMTPINYKIPFDQWGIDLITDLPTNIENLWWLIVGGDYFYKWVEAEPLRSIKQVQMIGFIWKNIICRFGLARVIVTDNVSSREGKSKSS